MPTTSFGSILSCGARLVAGCALLVALGCAPEETVTSYKVPKEKPKEQRLLGAIVPHKDRTWFFKLVGPLATIDKHEKEFQAFLDSVRFPEKGDKPITWTVPKDWEEKPSDGKLRYATLVLKTDAGPLELTVIPLGAEAGTLLTNVNRWRGQMGLTDTDEAGLKKLTSTIKVDGKDATLVDMKGESSGGR